MLAGLAAIMLLGRQFAALGSGLVAGGGLGLLDWLAIVAVPLAGALCVGRMRDAHAAYRCCLAFTGVTLACTLLAWLGFATGASPGGVGPWDLLPRAFTKSSSTLVWLDPVHRFLVVDTGSLSGADKVVTFLVEALSEVPGSLPGLG